jgi:hypothetical protein
MDKKGERELESLGRWPRWQLKKEHEILRPRYHASVQQVMGKLVYSFNVSCLFSFFFFLITKLCSMVAKFS